MTNRTKPEKEYYTLPTGHQLYETWDINEALNYLKLSAITHLYRAGKKDNESFASALKNAQCCIEIALYLLEQ